MPTPYTPKTLLKAVTDHYLSSGDFNGLRVNARMKPSVVQDLIGDGLVMLCREDQLATQFHPNIKMHASEAIEAQLRKIGERGLSGCLYPEPKHLEQVVNRSQYEGRPFKLLMAHGMGQLEVCAFDPQVLDQYSRDPRYEFRIDDISGSWRVKGDHEAEVPDGHRTDLQFGFALDEDHNRAAAAWVCDLAKMSPEHQQLWLPRRLPGVWTPHPHWYRQEILAEFIDEVPVCCAILEEIQAIRAISTLMGRKPLFKDGYEGGRPDGFMLLLRPTKREYDGFVQLLDKMLGDNIDKDFFREDVTQLFTEADQGAVPGTSKGTLRLLTEWLNLKWRVSKPEEVTAMLNTLKSVRKDRGGPAHAVRPDVWDRTLFKKQRVLLAEVYGALRTLRIIFGSHPAARGKFELSDGLKRGLICYV